MRVLALELTARGFAFAVLEGSERFVDWGGREVRADTGVSVFLAKIRSLVNRYRPDALIVEEPAGSRRDRRSREWLAWAEQFASEHALGHYAVTNADVQRQFSVAGRSRYAIALGVARLFPELGRHLPERRGWWHTEPLVIGRFIAAARGWAALRDLEHRVGGAA